MSEYPNSGILYRNKFKKAGSKAPDYTGKSIRTCVHCQQETQYEDAGWIQERNGKKFLAMRSTEKGEAERRKTEAQAKKSGLPTADTPSPQPQQGEGNIPF